jgi:hypothetical protein
MTKCDGSLIEKITGLGAMYAYSEAGQPAYVKLDEVVAIIRQHTAAQGDVVERVAKAIDEQWWGKIRSTMKSNGRDFTKAWEEMIPTAKAAIAAMGGVAANIGDSESLSQQNGPKDDNLAPSAQASEIRYVEKKIAFTCEQSGRRFEFENVSKLAEAFLLATRVSKPVMVSRPQPAPEQDERVLVGSFEQQE